MSISDDLMWRYIDLLSFQPVSAVQRWRADVAAGANPRDVKVAFAKEIVARFHSHLAAERAEADFQARFRQGQIPDEMPEHVLKLEQDQLALTQVLKAVGLTSSSSEAMRMIDQGGVRMDGERISDKAIALRRGGPFVLQVGKRKFARVTLT